MGYAGSLGAGAMVMGIIGGLMNNADAMDLHVTVSLFFPLYAVALLVLRLMLRPILSASRPATSIPRCPSPA